MACALIFSTHLWQPHVHVVRLFTIVEVAVELIEVGLLALSAHGQVGEAGKAGGPDLTLQLDLQKPQT